jgi:hypothetical protein
MPSNDSEAVMTTARRFRMALSAVTVALLAAVAVGSPAQAGGSRAI